jgi:hypothetical protein
MRTDADKHLEEAVASIRDAVRSLSKIVIEECEGSGDYDVGWKESVTSVLNSLIICRDHLSDL